MGRVYDALKKAAESKGTNDEQVRSDRSTREPKAPKPENGNGNHPWDRPSSILQNGTTSASTAHTEATIGSALTDGSASRVVGATLGAGSSTCSLEFTNVDISIQHVEPHLIAITQPRTHYAEQYRSLRTRILHAAERRKTQAIVITSSDMMEGKTLTSINLAWLLAQTDGVRALLIDGDLRSPCAAHYLGLQPSKGLSEVLSGESTISETIIKLHPSGLHLLPGGSPRDDVAELLSGPKFQAVLAEVRRMFDFIIIDAPPLGIFTDATVLVNRADGAMIVVRAGKSRYTQLEELLEPLPKDRLMGVVLNGVEEPQEVNYYYQRKRYYGQDRPSEEVKGT
jgi:protein-tyrosine kinase